MTVIRRKHHCPTCQEPLRFVHTSHDVAANTVTKTYECELHGRWVTSTLNPQLHRVAQRVKRQKESIQRIRKMRDESTKAERNSARAAALTMQHEGTKKAMEPVDAKPKRASKTVKTAPKKSPQAQAQPADHPWQPAAKQKRVRKANAIVVKGKPGRKSAAVDAEQIGDDDAAVEMAPANDNVSALVCRRKIEDHNMARELGLTWDEYRVMVLGEAA